jgi:uncharacterized protein (TIGR03067 family)
MRKNMNVLCWLGVMLLAAPMAAQTHVSNVLANLPAGTWHYFAMVPLRDGVRLATDIYVPAGSGTWPCVMMRTAYGRDNGGVPGYAAQVSNAGLRAVFVAQDPRGDGDSEGGGTFDPFNSENEINDGYDSVEWCATQSWCNGRVGIFGGSGHGMCASMAYLAKPPHLVVVKPSNTAGNTIEAWAFENRGRRWAYSWLTHRGATIQAWPKPRVSTYNTVQWQSILSNAAVNNPAVYIGDDGWWNFFHNGNFDFAAALAGHARFYLDVSTRTHGTYFGRAFPSKARPQSLPDFFAVLGGTAVATSSFVMFYHLGDATANLSNEWRVARTWPPPATPLPLYLQADGTASFTAPTTAMAVCTFAYHPTNPAPSIGGGFGYGVTNGFMDQRPLTNRADVLRFVTAPLSVPLDIVGTPRVELRFSTDVPDSLFVVKLLDIYPDGFEGILTESACMARYWPGLEATPAPVPTGTVCQLSFDLKTTAVTVLPGHRIGVLVTSSSDPAFDVHPNSFTQVWSYAASPTAHHQIHVGADAASQLVLPAVVPEGQALRTVIAALAVAGSTGLIRRAATPTAHNQQRRLRRRMAVKDALAQLAGTWQRVHATTDGKPTPTNMTATTRVVIKNSTHTVMVGDQIVAHHIRFRVDPTQQPIATTDFLPDGTTIKGICKIEGDTLTSCVAAVGQKRPRTFESTPGSGHTLRIFRRVSTHADTPRRATKTTQPPGH